MQCTPAGSVRLKVVRRTEEPKPPRSAGIDAALAVGCVADGNFCRCWMPAWFHLAELVANERRAADVEQGAAQRKTAA